MSEVKRYSAQPFSPSGLMFENEFGHYVLFCEYEKLKAENEKLKKDFSNFFDSSKIPEIEKLKAELKQVIEIGVEGQREINRKAHAEITKITAQRDTLKESLSAIDHLIKNSDAYSKNNLVTLIGEELHDEAPH